jgi:hypothetical protein
MFYIYSPRWNALTRINEEGGLNSSHKNTVDSVPSFKTAGDAALALLKAFKNRSNHGAPIEDYEIRERIDTPAYRTIV